jgi:hypothetical protein
MMEYFRSKWSSVSQEVSLHDELEKLGKELLKAKPNAQVKLEGKIRKTQVNCAAAASTTLFSHAEKRSP